MITAPALRGAILEEAILHLLRLSGYETVDQPGADPTLARAGAGLVVRGRGGDHQIDAVADFRISQPFGHPQRLLVEAKCYSDTVKLPVIRNAVGVVKDVAEYWSGGPRGAGQRSRYHYRYAVFSASDFTNDAERYAFAQDIYLLPLKRSRFFRPVVTAVQRFDRRVAQQLRRARADLRLSEVRRLVREALRRQGAGQAPAAMTAALDELVEACGRIQGALLAMLAGHPVFLVPGPGVDMRQLRAHYQVVIRWNERAWYLYSLDEKQVLFSFDLPPQLFLAYAEEGRLRPERALDLKQDLMSELKAIILEDGEPRQIVFHLDLDWLGGVRQELGRRAAEKDRRRRNGDG